MIVNGGKNDSEADRQIHTYYNAVDVDIVIKLNRQTGRWIGEQTAGRMDRQMDKQSGIQNDRQMERLGERWVDRETGGWVGT